MYNTNLTKGKPVMYKISGGNYGCGIVDSVDDSTGLIVVTNNGVTNTIHKLSLLNTTDNRPVVDLNSNLFDSMYELHLDDLKLDQKEFNDFINIIRAIRSTES